MSTTFKKPTVEERFHTAKHELSHGIIAYALHCPNIKIKVFKQPLVTSRDDVRCLGTCEASYPRLHYGLFVTAGPFASPMYNPTKSDYLEFKQLVSRYQSLTRKPVASFNTYVLDPVRNVLESDLAMILMQQLSVPLADGGVITARYWKDFERFFPPDHPRAAFDIACRQLREQADDYPFNR